MKPAPRERARCPICSETTAGAFHEGETVDVGVGCVKCSPDFCEVCGYVEVGNYSNPLIHRQRCEAVEDVRFLWAMNRGAPAGAD